MNGNGPRLLIFASTTRNPVLLSTKQVALALVVPGIMLVLGVLSINVFGDGVRDALDPRAKIRIGR